MALAILFALQLALPLVALSAAGGEPYRTIWEGLPAALALIPIITFVYILPVAVLAPFVARWESRSHIAHRWRYIKALLLALPFTFLWSIFLFLFAFRGESVNIFDGKPAIVSSNLVLVGSWGLWILPAAIVLRSVLGARLLPNPGQ
jgi:hypothetical protein